MNNLSNIANYKTTLDNQSHMIFLKYVGLIHEFIQCTIENIYIQNIEYLKYVITGYPFSTIKSKKLTALTVKAIIENPNNTTKNVFKISIKKF